MSQARLIESSKGAPPMMGIGGTGFSRDPNPGGQPSALQQKHLQHIVGSGRNSLHGAEDNGTGVGRNSNPFNGSNLQGPLA